jgi:hypothetical protein
VSSAHSVMRLLAVAGASPGSSRCVHTCTCTQLIRHCASFIDTSNFNLSDGCQICCRMIHVIAFTFKERRWIYLCSQHAVVILRESWTCFQKFGNVVHRAHCHEDTYLQIGVSWLSSGTFRGVVSHILTDISEELLLSLSGRRQS